MGDVTGNLLSALAGAVLTQLAVVIKDAIKRRGEYRALLNGIIAECDYNLSIVDEILNGAVNHNGSFKRLSVEFFRSAREGAIKYSIPQEMIRTLSRAIIDLELYNREADYIFNRIESSVVYTGSIGKGSIHVNRRTDGMDIKATMISARQGVIDTLNYVKELAEKVQKGENE